MIKKVDLFRALSIRNYRIYWIGQITSQIGYWLQLTALSHLVFKLTNSEIALSNVVFFSFIPILLFSTITGTLIDQINKPKALFVTQSLALIHALSLSILTFSGLISVQLIYILALFLGCVTAMDMPLRQSTLIELIDDRSLLPNAIALNSLQFNVARVIGPAIAGVLIIFFSEAWCFLLNALSYCSILLAILLITWPQHEHTAKKMKKTSISSQWNKGLQYLRGDHAIVLLLFVLSSISLTFASYSAFIPALAQRIFEQDVRMQSAILAMVGLGGIIGNLGLASLKDPFKLNYVVIIVGAVLTLSFIFLAYTSNIAIGLFLFFLIGGSLIILLASVNSLIQILVKQDHRGQIMGFYTGAVAGLYPVGALINGFIAEKLHLRTALMFIAAAGGLAVIIFTIQSVKSHAELKQRIDAI